MKKKFKDITMGEFIKTCKAHHNCDDCPFVDYPNCDSIMVLETDDMEREYDLGEEDIETIEKELEEHEQHKAIEEEQGIGLTALSNAIKGIKHRCVYNVEEKYYVFVNTIIFYGNDLIIKGYAENSVFLVKEYGKTWVLTKEVLL